MFYWLKIFSGRSEICFLSFEQLKFIYSEKATNFCEIFTLLLTGITQDKIKVKFSQNFVAFSECLKNSYLISNYPKNPFQMGEHNGLLHSFLDILFLPPLNYFHQYHRDSYNEDSTWYDAIWDFEVFSIIPQNYHITFFFNTSIYKHLCSKRTLKLLIS